MRISLAKGWQPDFPPEMMPEGGLVECSNCIPVDGKYIPFPDVSPYSYSSISDTELPLIAKEYKNNENEKFSYIGTNAKLYEFHLRGLTDRTRVSGDYNIIENNWNLVQYGEWIIATNYTDVPQILKTMGSGNFVALAGTPPNAKYAIFFKGHLILANVIISNVSYTKRIVWSAFEDIEDWTQSQYTGADYQDFPEANGDITGLATIGNELLIFFEDSITSAWYTGSPFTYNFSINRVNNIGAMPNTIIPIGTEVFFWSKADIWRYDGTQITPIGLGIKDAIFNNLETTSIHRITTYVNNEEGFVAWGYCSTGNTTPNKILVYNYKTNQFSSIDLVHQCLTALSMGGIEMDSIDTWKADTVYQQYDTVIPDTTYPNGFEYYKSNASSDVTASIEPSFPVINGATVTDGGVVWTARPATLVATPMDNWTYPMDSTYYQSEGQNFGCVDANNYLSSFTGQQLQATIETGDVNQEDTPIFMVNKIRSNVKATGTANSNTMEVGIKYNEDSSIAYSTPALEEADGYHRMRSVGRYMRFRLKAQNFSYIAPYIDANIKITGRR